MNGDIIMIIDWHTLYMQSLNAMHGYARWVAVTTSLQNYLPPDFFSSATAFCNPLKNDSWRSGSAALTIFGGSLPFKSVLIMYTTFVLSGCLQLDEDETNNTQS